ncbi:MAG TPA: 4Fe-4S binding protein [Anaerohalosphaeraceae bacterium]|nr:4Fe-4S binding protein [Anaerohalosphaeraceae bacterium]
MSCLGRAGFWMGLILSAAAVQAAERFPPPQFETDYQMPTLTTPPPRAAVWEMLDVAVLAAALGLASWLILRKRSRRGIAALSVFSLLYFGFWRQGCICSVGSLGNVVLSLFDSSYVLPLTAAAFFLLPIFFTLFFGRVFCGAVCPLGAIQDWVVFRPLAVPAWLETALRLGAWLYLAAAVLFAAVGAGLLICRYDPFIAFFRLGLNTPLWLLGLLFLAVGVFIARPYCRFVCPYGLLLRQAGRLSFWHVRITPDECIQCRLCEDACPFGAIQPPTAPWPESMRPAERRRLVLLSGLLLVLMGLGGWLGYRVHPRLAAGHPSAELARQVRLRQAGLMTEPTDMVRAFEVSGRTLRSLWAQEAEVFRRFAWGGLLAGVFVGFVAGVKLIQMSIHFKRTDYEADRAGCLACGRCFAFCPRHRIWETGKPTDSGETS